MTDDDRKLLEQLAIENGVTAAEIHELHQKKRPPANWQKWAHFPKAELWQCVALSFGVEPVDATMRAVRAGFTMSAEPKPRDWFAEHPEMRERLDVARANAGSDEMSHLHPLPGGSGDMASRLFSTAEFGAWARSIWGVAIPAAFPGHPTITVESGAADELGLVPSVPLSSPVIPTAREEKRLKATERRATLLVSFRKLDGKRSTEGGKKGKHGALAALSRQTGIDDKNLGQMLDRAIKDERDADMWASLAKI